MKTVKKKRRKFRVLIVILSIVGVLALGMGGAIVFSAPGRDELKNLVIPDVDFKRLRDGIFTGEYRGTKDKFRDATVEVTVDSGAVTNITVTGGALAGDKQATEIRDGKTIKDLFGEVIKAQSLQVDAISGATLTCNAHLMAVEKALEKAELTSLANNS